MSSIPLDRALLQAEISLAYAFEWDEQYMQIKLSSGLFDTPNMCKQVRDMLQKFCNEGVILSDLSLVVDPQGNKTLHIGYARESECKIVRQFDMKSFAMEDNFRTHEAPRHELKIVHGPSEDQLRVQELLGKLALIR